MQQSGEERQGVRARGGNELWSEKQQKKTSNTAFSKVPKQKSPSFYRCPFFQASSSPNTKPTPKKASRRQFIQSYRSDNEKKKKQMSLYIFFFFECVRVYNIYIYIFIFLYIYNLTRTHTHTSMKTHTGSQKTSTRKRITVTPHFLFLLRKRREERKNQRKKNAVSKREVK